MVTQMIFSFENLMQSPIMNALAMYEADAMNGLAGNARKPPKAWTKLFKQARRI